MSRAYHFHDVGMFHHKFGLDNVTNSQTGPREIPEDLLQFRIKFIFEELQELLEGMGYVFDTDLYTMGMQATSDYKKQEVDEAQQFDALIDMVYVIYGLAHLKGYPWEQGWIAVQHANMQKERATQETASERGGTWDIVKPVGWKAPDMAAILREHGWPE